MISDSADGDDRPAARRRSVADRARAGPGAPPARSPRRPRSPSRARARGGPGPADRSPPAAEPRSRAARAGRAASPRAGRRPGGVAAAAEAAADGSDGSRVLSPVVRRLIAEHDLDPAQIEGTGAGGRITRSDVLALIDRRNGGRPSGPAAGSGPPAAGAGRRRPAASQVAPTAPAPRRPRGRRP